MPLIERAAVIGAQKAHLPAFGRKCVGQGGDQPAANTLTAARGNRLPAGHVGFAARHSVGPHRADQRAFRRFKRPDAGQAVGDGGAGFGVKGVPPGRPRGFGEKQVGHRADGRRGLQPQAVRRLFGYQRQALPRRQAVEVQRLQRRQRGRAVGRELFNAGELQKENEFFPVLHRAAELGAAARDCQRRIRQGIQFCRRAGVAGPERKVPPKQRPKERLAGDRGRKGGPIGRCGDFPDAAAHAVGSFSGSALTIRLYSRPRASKFG